jgi:glycosyltransferase involved in cell wall biosynthesis
MGKKTKAVKSAPSSSANDQKTYYPMVSVCTPTFNRRPFIQNMFQCFRNQDYPKNRIEWIIVDDGTDKIRDLIASSNIPNIRYYEVAEKMTLGAKRNYMHSFVRGSFVVYMDDDDYYPPDRISHAVERLQSSPTALCAGSSEIYIYFKHISKMIQCGPYGPNHATAGTFAFKSELLKITKYEESAALAEERAFLKDYTIPFIQLDPLKSILVFSHEHNTFDKRKMLENPHPDFLKESPKTVEMFIKNKNEAAIHKFFMEEIDNLLLDYEPGLPKMKPDVLAQIKVIEANRDEMIRAEMEKQKANGPIILQRPGQESVQLSNQDVVNIIQQQQEQLGKMAARINELETINVSLDSAKKANSDDRVRELETAISTLQKQLIEKTRAANKSAAMIKTLEEKLASSDTSTVQPELPVALPEVLSSNTEPETITFETHKCEPEVFVDMD